MKSFYVVIRIIVTSSYRMVNKGTITIKFKNVIKTTFLPFKVSCLRHCNPLLNEIMFNVAILCWFFDDVRNLCARLCPICWTKMQKLHWCLLFSCLYWRLLAKFCHYFYLFGIISSSLVLASVSASTYNFCWFVK